MSSSPPDTVTVRPATLDDAEAVAYLIRASEISVRGNSFTAAGDIRDSMRLVDLPNATWIFEEAGEVVASGILMTMRENADFWGVVHPKAKGRGLGTALVDRAEAAARAFPKRALHVGTYSEDRDAAALLSARGYRDVRHYFTMVVDLDEPPTPVWPDGIRGDSTRPEEAWAFKDAIDEAFADEWGWQPMTREEFQRLRLDAPETNFGLWLVARDGDEIAAAARCEAERWGGGWVGAIGVRPKWRRRGLGLALLEHAFAEFHRRGERTIRLGVDAQNPTGATRLYERAGMRVESEEVVYERVL